MKRVPLLNAFTVDVEDYFQVSAFEHRISRTDWPGYESRVEASTDRLLGLLDEFSVRGTFFILGWVADRFPQLVMRICERGHEIGSHSYWHRLVYQLSPDEFREDLRRSRDVLQDITGQAVTSYRAPSFSITRRSLWALEILVEEGFQVDSSIFPVYHDRYGIPDGVPHIHELQTPAGPLWEFPPTIAQFGQMRLPVAGGGYFRLYPWSMTSYCLRRVNQARPFVFYVHPWEIDPDQPRVSCGWRHRFRHYVNLARTEGRLRRLLRQFQFGTVHDVIYDTGRMAITTTP